MKTTTWKKLVKPLLPDNDSWGFRGRLVFSRPLGHVLCGVLAEGSAYTESVFLWQVRMPLYVPADVITLNWSDRLVANTLDPSDREAFHELLMSGLSRARSESREDNPLQVLRKSAWKDNLRMREDLAYAFALNGRPREALHYLEDVERYQAQYDWDQKMVERSSMIGDFLQRGDLDAVKRQLEEWKRHTIAALGLPPN